MDYYAVLGVARNAEVIVIQAAYKALVRKYHPDVFKGKKAAADKKIREINEAYDTLSDPKKRSKYDETLDSEDGGVGDYARYNEDEDLASSVREPDWALLIEYYPEAENHRVQLASISQKAALYFQILLLELKVGNDCVEWANVVREYFMERYFGTSAEVHSVVYALLKMGRKDLAMEINRAVKVLGNSSSNEIITKFKEKYGKIFTATHIVTAPFHRYKEEPAILYWYAWPGDEIPKGSPLFHVEVEKTGKKIIINADRKTTIIDAFKGDGYHIKNDGEELGLIVH
jgi:hypothetical protein